MEETTLKPPVLATVIRAIISPFVLGLNLILFWFQPILPMGWIGLIMLLSDAFSDWSKGDNALALHSIRQIPSVFYLPFTIAYKYIFGGPFYPKD